MKVHTLRSMKSIELINRRRLSQRANISPDPVLLPALKGQSVALVGQLFSRFRR
jgi:hypothetical protein